MRDAVIVEAVRAPVGKRNGGPAEVHPATREVSHPVRVNVVRRGLQTVREGRDQAPTTVIEPV